MIIVISVSKMAYQIILLTVAFLVLFNTLGNSKKIIIVPLSLNESYVCPEDETCCLISSCNFQNIFHEKILQLILLDGNHTLTSHLTVSKFSSVIIGPLGNYTPSIVTCQYRFIFQDILSSLTMHDVSFLDCQHPSTEACWDRFIVFQYIPYVTITNAAIVRFETAESERSYCDYSLRVSFNIISNLTISGVSFIGYESLSTVIDIFLVELVVFHEATFQYANVILVGKKFNIVNSHANFLTLEMCTPAEEPATQIAIVGSVLNETLITMCSSQHECTQQFLYTCATKSFRFDLRLSNSLIQARKDVSCDAIRFTVSSHTSLFIGLQDVVCIGNIFADVFRIGSHVGIQVNNSILLERGSACTTGIEVTTVQAEDNVINVIIESSKVAAGVRIRSLSSVDDTFKIAIRNTSFVGSSYGLSLLDDKYFLYRSFTLLVAILNTSFSSISGLAVVLNVPSYRSDARVNITDTTFANNKRVLYVGRNDGGHNVPSDSYSYIEIKLLRCEVIDNGGDLNSNEAGGIMSLISVNEITLDNCTIANNNNSGLFAFLTDVVIVGKTVFQNNTAVQGGALSLWYSYLKFPFPDRNTELVISNNRAQNTGGGIFFSNNLPSYDRDTSEVRCIVQFDSHANFEVHFSNNTANNGGDNVFGARIQTNCTQAEGWVRYLLSQHFKFHSTSFSSVSSDPTRVCLCDKGGVARCTDIEYTYAFAGPFFPGEIFSIRLVLVGNDFGSVKGLIYASLPSQDAFTSLGPKQSVQIITEHRKCSVLAFSIESLSINVVQSLQISARSQQVPYLTSQTTDAIHLYKNLSTIPYILLQQPVSISVTLEDCPISMILSQNPPYTCSCHPRLLEAGIKICVISYHTGMVYRSEKTWVGSYGGNSNETLHLMVHKVCPFDYCDAKNISVDPKSPDNQCAFNRSGLLCGACRNDLSVVFGSTRCLECDNSFISLVFFFALAGVLLVVFLQTLTLTVAKGTINGLVFYSNIVWATKSIYLKDSNNSSAQILHVFLAWLNLDLGIETCFFDGLDAYWKTWLQFVFPVYIWSLTGLIIVTSHYSTRASKIFGNNSVPVLATLILLSYTKLLRAIIDSLNFSILEYGSGKLIVWTLDGNYPYFGVAHIILLLVVLAFLVLLWLPFTTILLTLQCLRRSNVGPLRWINKFKPFFDAYFGQLKPKHHYWIGLLLLVRVLLLVVYASTSAIVPTVNIALMVLVSMLLLLVQVYAGSVYKSIYLSILENSFIVNLMIVGVIALYLDTINESNAAVMHTSIAIALVQFLAILLYHFASNLRTTYSTWKRRQPSNGNEAATEARPMPPVVHNQMQYREPLLENSAKL